MAFVLFLYGFFVFLFRDNLYTLRAAQPLASLCTHSAQIMIQFSSLIQGIRELKGSTRNILLQGHCVLYVCTYVYVCMYVVYVCMYVYSVGC